nr:MAG: hypothetical protein [Armillaria mellea ambi-like virus 5]
MAHANLPVPFKDYRPEINSSNNIPVGSGLCLAYVRELCLPDYRIIPAVVSRYFLGLLGSDAEEAQEVFEGLKGSWGNICRTELGFELAHLFWSAAFAIESRSQIVAIVPSSGVYVGCIVIGEGYKVDIRNRLVEPCVRSDLVEAFGALSPHDSSLAKIYWLLTYAQDEARIQDREACKSFQQLRRDIVNHPYRSDKKSEVEKLAMQLVFPGAEPLTPTPYNVAVVLGAIADETKAEDGFPLYPRCITEDSRAVRLLSAFGHYAPSFLVPGGKLMMLDKPFEVSVGTKKGGGDDSRRIVTKIGFIMKPLDQAVADLLRVREIKGVHNPHGSNIMGRTSANSLIRSAETENASSIIYALRMYTGTSVADVVAGKKRARDEGVQGEGSKKRRVDDW